MCPKLSFLIMSKLIKKFITIKIIIILVCDRLYKWNTLYHNQNYISVISIIYNRMFTLRPVPAHAIPNAIAAPYRTCGL